MQKSWEMYPNIYRNRWEMYPNRCVFAILRNVKILFVKLLQNPHLQNVQPKNQLTILLQRISKHFSTEKIGRKSAKIDQF
jgi:hypothetical protein